MDGVNQSKKIQKASPKPRKPKPPKTAQSKPLLGVEKGAPDGGMARCQAILQGVGLRVSV